MPETKLDQSLDEIVSGNRAATRKSTRPRPRGARAPQPTRNVSGGIVKKIVNNKTVNGSTPKGATSATTGSDRIQVSNLPRDVSETQIKEYFTQSVGPVKRVELNYGPGGVSRGIALIIFRNTSGPAKAVEELNGVLVDGKPIKIDILVGAREAATLVAKSLGDRVTTKNQPKSAGKKETATRGSANTGARGGKRGGAKPRSARPAKKTAAELDSEMADYFEQGGSTENGGTAAGNGAANAEAMDEVL